MAERRLVAYFVGRDELTPTLNRINGGLTNTARISDQAATRMGGQAGMLTREWSRFQRAFGHAISYAAIYKIYEAYNNLKNFNSELGQLNAMLPGTGKNIGYLGDQALRISTITGAPLNDVQESINNIVQSIPDLGEAAQRHLVPAMAQIEAMASRIMDVDPRSFGATVLGIARAFHPAAELRGPEGPKIIEQIASRLFETRRTTPRVTGQDITQYIPTLIGGAASSGFGLDQTLAMFHTAQQIIQRPATTTQYLRQLMLRIQKPTSAAQKFFNMAGLTPNVMSNLSGPEILQRLTQFGLLLPGGISRERLGNLRTGRDIQRVHLTGQSATFFRNAVGGRIQSEVAMTALLTNAGETAKQEQRLKNNLNAVNEAYEKWRSYNSLGVAQNALSNMTTDLLRNFNPALMTSADALTDFSGLMQKGTDHLRKFDRNFGSWIQGELGMGTKRNIVGGALDTGLTVGAIYGIFGKRGLVRGTKDILGRIGRARAARAGMTLPEEIGIGTAEGTRAGSTLMRPFTSAFTAEASFAALAGQANGTPSMPFWVVIHPLSKTTVPEMFGTHGSAMSSGEKSVENKIKNSIWNRVKGTVGGGAIGGLAAKYGSAIARAAGKAGGAAGAAVEGTGNILGRVPGGPLAGFGGALGLEAALALVFPETAGAPSNRGDIRFGDFNITKMFPGSRNKQLQILRALSSGRNLHSKYAQSGNVRRIVGQLEQRNITPAQAEAQLEAGLKNYLRATHPGIGNAGLQKLAAQTLNKTHISGGRSQNVNFEGFDATFTLEPTQEFKNLLKPQKVKVHIKPMQSTSPPTERGKKKVTRNRG